MDVCKRNSIHIPFHVENLVPRSFYGRGRPKMGFRTRTSIGIYFLIESLVPRPFCGRRRPFRKKAKIIDFNSFKMEHGRPFSGRRNEIPRQRAFLLFYH